MTNTSTSLAQIFGGKNNLDLDQLLDVDQGGGPGLTSRASSNSFMFGDSDSGMEQALESIVIVNSEGLDQKYW